MRTQQQEDRAPRRFSLPHDFWFLLVVLALGLSTVFALSQGANLVRPGFHFSVTERPVQQQLYPFPPKTGLMQPAVDAQSNVWVGEMYANRLARLNSQTGVVTAWKVPHGQDGVMETTIGPDGGVWFVEQSANYIGRFDPTTHTFRLFPLGDVHGRPFGPQDLQFDRQGNLWFTGPISGSIGRLQLHTGKIQFWLAPAPRAGMAATPFGLTVTPAGQVWFGYLTGGAIGHFDPATNRITLVHLPNQNAQLFSLDADARGQIWFSEMNPGVLGMLDPTSGKVTELPVPNRAGQVAALYELVAAPTGEIWCANSGTNTLVRYAPQKRRYTLFTLSPSTGAAYGLARGAAGQLWLTYSSASTGNAVGKITPELASSRSAARNTADSRPMKAPNRVDTGSTLNKPPLSGARARAETRFPFPG